jgi:hypothetical protein
MFKRKASVSAVYRWIGLSLTIGSLAVGLPAVGEAQLILYDDFKGKLIDPDRWYGAGRNGTPDAPSTENVRQIKGGQLELRVLQHGRDDVNGGGQFSGVNLGITNPAPIRTLQAAVKVALAEAQACSANTGNAIAGLSLKFFNDGSSSGPGDATGDIQVQLFKWRDANQGSVYYAEYWRCSDPSCSTRSGVNQFFSNWKTNESNVLTVTWDAPNKQFVYSVKRGKITDTVELPYTFSDTDPPGVDFKFLSSGAFAVNCSGSRTHSAMDALFNNVMINP